MDFNFLLCMFVVNPFIPTTRWFTYDLVAKVQVCQALGVALKYSSNHPLVVKNSDHWYTLGI